jgi:hypothetical protein
MAKSTMPIVITGALTILNDEVIDNKPWAEALPVVVMTGALALALAGLEQLSPALAVGLGWIAVITRLLIGGDKSIVAKFTRFQQGGAK